MIIITFFDNIGHIRIISFMLSRYTFRIINQLNFYFIDPIIRIILQYLEDDYETQVRKELEKYISKDCVCIISDYLFLNCIQDKTFLNNFSEDNPNGLIQKMYKSGILFIQKIHHFRINKCSDKLYNFII